MKGGLYGKGSGGADFSGNHTCPAMSGMQQVIPFNAMVVGYVLCYLTLLEKRLLRSTFSTKSGYTLA